MENISIYQVIAFIIFGVIMLVGRYAKKKKLADQDKNPQDEGGMKLPSWLEGLVEGNEVQKPAPPQQEQALMVPPQVEQEETKQPKHPVVPSKQPKPEEPSSVPASPPPKERKIAGLPLSPKTFRQAIILSEILKPAKSVQK